MYIIYETHAFALEHMYLSSTSSSQFGGGVAVLKDAGSGIIIDTAVNTASKVIGDDKGYTEKVYIAINFINGKIKNIKELNKAVQVGNTRKTISNVAEGQLSSIKTVNKLTKKTDQEEPRNRPLSDFIFFLYPTKLIFH